MAKIAYVANPRVTQIFDDLEKYFDFCRDYGYRPDERDLYNQKSYAWQQYNKCIQGKPAKNMWSMDASRRYR